jgi:hypothetical protein
MPAKTVFISSTYKDLKDHRREVWDALKRFDVAVRGMEEFGARTTGPLDTCLAEVEQSDVYVGIIAYRLGSIDPDTKRPFTVLEYEKAVEQKKEILIYIADDESASFPQSVVDKDTRLRQRLAAFKDKLRERHTVDTFSTPDDLAEKLSRDFKKRFSPIQETRSDDKPAEDVFAKTAKTLEEFRLIPKRYNGHQVRLVVSFYGSVFPANRKLCQHFNLDYGFTVGAYMRVVKPDNRAITSGFNEMYATGNKVDALRTLIKAKEADLYAQLQFTPEDVNGVHGEFLGRTEYDGDDGYDDQSDPNEVYVPPEGKAILLFTKPAE